ncbi:MAG: arylsulfatase [Chloroflexota bacterium]
MFNKNTPQDTKQPNVILILVDDMGFADLGVMGSEIHTPNIDSLAQHGVLLSAMYNCARCCPTRASLLTGLYPHRAGVGQMGANLGTPAYQGYLRKDTATIAEVLKANGYRTLMAGKWHVGGDLHASKVDQWQIGTAHHPSPRQRGFDRFYGIVDGVTHFFSPHYIQEDDTQVPTIADDFYFTDAITDKAIDMVEESVDQAQPFFLYLAHAAPHWPLHSPEEDIVRYDGVYAKGWDAVRTARHETMCSANILQENWEISARDVAAPLWEDILHQDWEAHRMAVYAAMIDRMDQSIGRLLDTLRRLDQYENTLILFLSDNGGCAEFMAEDGWAKWFPDITHDGRKITMGNKPDVRPGGPLTYMSYDLPWANVSNAPFRLFKHWVHEGGISTPLIAHWPARLKEPTIHHAPCHVVDILPTIMAATNSPYLTEREGHEVQALDGESFLPLLENRAWSRQQPIYWEHEGNCAIRLGHFKLVRQFNQPWELYDMNVDRTELNNLIEKNKPMGQRLQQMYEGWAESAGVLDWNIALPRLQQAWQMDDIHG